MPGPVLSGPAFLFLLLRQGWVLRSRSTKRVSVLDASLPGAPEGWGSTPGRSESILPPLPGNRRPGLVPGFFCAREQPVECPLYPRKQPAARGILNDCYWPYVWIPPTQLPGLEGQPKPKWGPYMRNSTTISVDLAKNVIQVSVVSFRGKELLNRSFTRTRFAEFLGKQKPSLVAFESCASVHHWARAAKRHGHEACIIPAKAVTPFRQGRKTDSNDALAVADAARRPNIKNASELWSPLLVARLEESAYVA